MLKFRTLDLSEGIDVNKTKFFCKCLICHYWYILEINFRYQI